MRIAIVYLFTFIFSIYSQWISQAIPSDLRHVFNIDFYDQNIGIAGGSFYVSQPRSVFTTNSGTNWTLSTLPDSLREINDVQLVSQNIGYCVGSYRTNDTLPKGMFLKTTNGGQSWFSAGSIPSHEFFLYGLDFININTGYIIAQKTITPITSEVLKTTNGGLQWTILFIDDSVDLRCIETAGSNYVLTGGIKFVNGTPNGIMFRSTNSGNSWESRIITNTIFIKKISFTNSSTGFAVCDNWGVTPLILRTTNSGLNWLVSYSLPPGNSEWRNIDFVRGTGNGIAVGSDNITSTPRPLICKTTNFGLNWSISVIQDTANLWGVSLPNENIWFVCGGPVGKIYKTTNAGGIGINQISMEVPYRYHLYQNYPNPFNPTTKIRFNIPSLLRRGAGVVVLKVYDILGKVIATLVNEHLSPGTYEVEWDGTGYPSGTYFYQLVTADFSKTKKMALIK